MKFTAEKTELLNALSRCLSVADGKSTMPVLANVCLEATEDGLHVSATDIMRSITVSVPGVIDALGALCLPARDLYDRVKLLPDGSIALSTEGTKATLKTIGSTRRFTMHGIPSDEFPSIPEPSGSDAALTSTTTALGNLLAYVHHAISTDPSRLAMNSLLLESCAHGDIRMVATDGHRLSTVVSGGDPRGQQWLIPLTAVNDLRRLFDKEQAVTLKQDRGTLFAELQGLTFSTKLVDGIFPPWQQIVPTSFERTVTVERAALINALRAVSVSSGMKTGSVRFTFKKGALVLDAESPYAGDSFDEVPCDYEGLLVTLGFNSKYMLDALGAIPAEQVTISSNAELDPTVVRAVESEKFLAVVMPLKV